MSEIKFDKYEKRGSGYHYKQINKKRLFDFNSFVFGRYKVAVDLVVKYVENNFNKDQNIKILDLGCGDGVLLYLLSERTENFNIDFYGVDSSDIALQVASQKNKSINFINSDVYELSFENDFFDIIVSSDVIEHVTYPEKMLGEIKRVLRKDGFAVIGTPIKITEKPLDKNHYQEFFQEEFLNLFGKYFPSKTLIGTHELLHYLLYNRKIKLFSKNPLVFRYIYNSLNILFSINFFTKKRKKRNQIFSYMHLLNK
jgi:ubiquinone/menaquinone biosynthesis C-methylase UbiE